jgi:hypothetical protein
MKQYLVSKGQIICNCERGIMLAMRFGGLACLKYVNEGNPSVVELLNPLL